MKTTKKLMVFMAIFSISLSIINYQPTTVSATLRMNATQKKVNVKKGSGNKSKVDTTFTIQTGTIDWSHQLKDFYNPSLGYQDYSTIKVITATPTKSNHNLLRVTDNRAVKKDWIKNGTTNAIKVLLSNGISEIPYVGTASSICQAILDIKKGYNKTVDLNDCSATVETELRVRSHTWVYVKYTLYGKSQWLRLGEFDKVRYIQKTHLLGASVKNPDDVFTCLKATSLSDSTVRNMLTAARLYPPESGWAPRDFTWNIDACIGKNKLFTLNAPMYFPETLGLSDYYIETYGL